MRTIRKIEYTVIRESDISQNNIYAFGNSKGINILCRKNDKFFWKDLEATNLVWYEMYTSIENALDGVLKQKGYSDGKFSEILEFSNQREFFRWALNTIEPGLILNWQ